LVIFVNYRVKIAKLIKINPLQGLISINLFAALRLCEQLFSRKDAEPQSS